MSNPNDKETYIANNCADVIAMSVCLLDDNSSLVKCNDGLYEFNGKCYDLIDNTRIDEMYYTFCTKYGVTKQWKNISLITRAVYASSKVPSIEEMNLYDDLICINNGILNIRTKELFPHDKKYHFDSFINVEYKPEEKDCSSFLKYLQSTFNNDTAIIQNIIYLGGYILDISCKAERMFMLDGPGGSGKSTLINTLDMFFDKSQVSPLSLEELSSGSFDKELLITSRLNFCAETKKNYIEAEEIKKIVSGDLIKVSRKHKLAFSFRPKTKIIVACNGLPKFNDTSDGIYRRLVIIPFNNQYKSVDEIKHIKHAEKRHIFEKDYSLMDNIRSEKSAILNLFLGGLLELMDNKYQFIDSKASNKAMETFRKDSDTVREFLEEEYEIDYDNSISVRDVFNNYRDWYANNVQSGGAMKFRTNEMGRRIKEVFGVDKLGPHNIYNSQSEKYERITFYNLKIKDNYDVTDGDSIVSGDIEDGQREITF